MLIQDTNLRIDLRQLKIVLKTVLNIRFDYEVGTEFFLAQLELTFNFNKEENSVKQIEFN